MEDIVTLYKKQIELENRIIHESNKVAKTIKNSFIRDLIRSITKDSEKKKILFYKDNSKIYSIHT